MRRKKPGNLCIQFVFFCLECESNAMPSFSRKKLRIRGSETIECTTKNGDGPFPFVHMSPHKNAPKRKLSKDASKILKKPVTCGFNHLTRAWKRRKRRIEWECKRDGRNRALSSQIRSDAFVLGTKIIHNLRLNIYLKKRIFHKSDEWVNFHLRSKRSLKLHNELRRRFFGWWNWELQYHIHVCTKAGRRLSHPS